LKKLGGEAKHQKWVMQNGLGYNDTVGNLRKLLTKLNIDESEFVKQANIILMKDYEGIDKEIENLLVKISKTKDLKRKNSIILAFQMIESEYFPMYLNTIY
jgi:predicted transcriptional regulator